MSYTEQDLKMAVEKVRSDPTLKEYTVPKPQAIKSKIRFVDLVDNNFEVVKKRIVAYHGKVVGSRPNKKDYCECMSFTINNTLIFVQKHNHSFQCKHIEEARSIRFSGYPLEVSN